MSSVEDAAKELAKKALDKEIRGPTLKELKERENVRDATDPEKKAFGDAFKDLRVYWGPDIWGKGPNFRMSEEYRHWFRYKENGVDVFRGGTIRLVDHSGEGLRFQWSHGARVWGHNTERPYHGNTDKLDRDLRKFILRHPDFYKRIPSSKIPRPKILIEEVKDEDGSSDILKNVWFVVGDEVRDRFIVMRDPETKSGKLSWNFRTPTLKTFFSDMAKVGAFISKFTDQTGVLGKAFGKFIDNDDAIASLAGLAGKLQKAEETVDDFFDSLGDDGVGELGKLLTDVGLGETTSPRKILKVAILLANLDIQLP